MSGHADGDGDGDGASFTDPQAAAGFVRAHTPLRAETIVPLGAGMSSVAWRIDHVWAARFPLTTDAREAQSRELSLAPLLARELPVAVPVYEHVVQGDDGRPRLTIHRVIEGAPLTVKALQALAAPARSLALEELAGSLTVLHRISLDRARAAGATVRPHEGFGHPSQRQLHHCHAVLLGAIAVERVEALWRRYESDERAREHLALSHADLQPAHVLHDPADGHITAIIDWGDACLAHVQYDGAISGLFFDHAVRNELAERMPGTTVVRTAAVAPLIVAVRWLCDLELALHDGEPELAAECRSALLAHLGGNGG